MHLSSPSLTPQTQSNEDIKMDAFVGDPKNETTATTRLLATSDVDVEDSTESPVHEEVDLESG